jgi:fatty-acyl-CoA synthase
MLEGGHVNMTGRAKEMLIRGGENIFPREIEEFLVTHPKISDVGKAAWGVGCGPARTKL